MATATGEFHTDYMSDKVGEVWQRQGDAFLREQEAALAYDVERLRATLQIDGRGTALERLRHRPRRERRSAPEQRPSPPEQERAATAVIDLTDSTEPRCVRHQATAPVACCSRCHDALCADCLVDGRQPLCVSCALLAGGVRTRR